MEYFIICKKDKMAASYLLDVRGNSINVLVLYNYTYLIQKLGRYRRHKGAKEEEKGKKKPNHH